MHNPFSVSEMLEAFKKFFQLPNSELIKMGGRSREIAEELFNKERFINEYIALIEG